MPMRDTLLQTFYGIVKNTTASTEQAVKGKALLCAGSLASACGKENFPQEALEEQMELSKAKHLQKELQRKLQLLEERALRESNI